jgi:hypothetical protein
MNTWKILNKSNQEVKVACKTASMASKGIILKPNEFCLSESQLTASMDAQERRGFISIDRTFDNSKLNLEFVKNYKESELSELIHKLNLEILKEQESKSDFEKAAEDAQKYIDNNPNK